MWRVVKAVVGSLVAGGAGLFFGFAMGLHDARWSEAWTEWATRHPHSVRSMSTPAALPRHG